MRQHAQKLWLISLTYVYEKPLNNLILVQSKLSSFFTKDRFFLVLEKSSFLILPWKMWLYSLPSCRREKERTWIGLFGFNRSDFLLCLSFSYFDIFLGSTGHTYNIGPICPVIVWIRSKPAFCLHIWWQ